ncbi:hypothetical protein ABFZ85_00830 [Hyphococcus formosus]|uniref:hypothetical protein n=1 Tax=Hyphococcus formosus TaxID=3143534 RepID=UPI00398B67A5
MIARPWLVTSLVLFSLCACSGSNGETRPTPTPSPPPATPTPAPVDPIPSQSGSLSSYLTSLEFGTANDGIFQVPGASKRLTLSDTIVDILNSDYSDAHDKAETIGYELIEFNDTDTGITHYLLREKNMVPSAGSHGGGTFVFNPAASRNVAIHVPHPKFDQNTNLEGIAAYLELDVRYFLMAGVHRRSSPVASSCQNFSDYRVSDAVHNDEHLFFVAQKAIEDFDSTVHYIEFHGFGASSLATLQSQCAPGDNDKLVNLSETRSLVNASGVTLMTTLESIINAGGQISACIYSPVLNVDGDDLYTTSLGGTTNTSGRYTNGSVDVCDMAAEDASNTHRYLHIEQSSKVRSDHRDLMIDYIDQALDEFL